MNNVLLDPLPITWESAQGEKFALDTDFRIGIQICLIQEDPDLSMPEKSQLIRELLFPEDVPDDFEDAVNFFMEGWHHDNPSSKKEKQRLMDFDVDQWRIYSAFYSQYRIDLSTAELHWWTFMGMLSALTDCAYTRVIDIRQRKYRPKMDKEDRKALREAKEVYELKQPMSYEEKAFGEEMDDLLGISASEKRRIENFEKFGK